LSRTAELYTRRGEYEKALGFAAKAMDISMYDSEANYTYGIAARRLGRLADAKETLGWASRSTAYRSSAYVQLAEIAALEGNGPLALDYAEKALDANRYDSSALEVEAVVSRVLGRPGEARRAVDRLLDFDPLDHLGRFELYLLDPTAAHLAGFKSMVRSELPHESYLEMAMFYVRIGRTDDAVTLLEKAPEQPEVEAWLAYLLKDQDPNRSKARLDKALSLSPLLVFPFREESIPVFEWAAARRPEDWKPKYYLALILWGKGRVDETRALFDRCGGADFAPFFIARGYLAKEGAPDKALADFRRAAELDARNWRVWHTLLGYLEELGRKSEGLDVSAKAAGLFPDTVPILVDRVRALLALGRNEEAASVLAGLRALPYEGASDIHALYVRTHQAIALDMMGRGAWARAIDEWEKSKLYPETLGTGAPFEPDARLQDYFEAVCLDRLGNAAQARAIRGAMRDYSLKHWNERGPNAYFGALVLERMGEEAKARQLFKTASLPEPEVLAALKKYAR
ncbi:MAG TPA: tetratricopeptide repeat protein, partial [Burkholderiales bacterium]|nr:tetratricopeptide repeat protein [Burkholderiales bacterium]